MLTVTPYDEPLRDIEERLARRVASIHGTISAVEIAVRDNLRQSAGKQWDASRKEWQPLEEQYR